MPTEPQRLLPELSHNFGICDQQDASSEGRNEGYHWVRSRALRTMFRVTAIQISAKRLPSVRFCAVTAPNDFQLFGTLKKHIRDNKFQGVAKVHEAVSQ